MVIEMTGGYSLVVPTMLSVVLAVLVQQTLTRRSRYPSLYEAQVPSPAESPVHHGEYYRTTVALLRKNEIRLDDDVMLHEMADRLGMGEGVPMPGTSQHLYALKVAKKSAAAWKRVWQIPLPPDAVLVTVLRDHTTVAVHGDTLIEVGDRVVVAALPKSVPELRKAFGDPKAGGTRPAEAGGAADEQAN
jgi:CIC family chloride channel protein